MKSILLLCVILSARLFADSYSETYAKEKAQSLRQEIARGGITRLLVRTDQSLDAVVGLSLKKLHEAGDDSYADMKEWEWSGQYSGYLTRMRDICDHKPLIQWLADFYNHVESVLGVTLCKALHLSDIKTFNYCIPIVFNPKNFPMDAVTGPRSFEYLKHCNQGAVYYGLLPVVTYWIVDIACMVGTSGTGVVLMCGGISDLAEMIMAQFFAMPLCQAIYTAAGGT